MRALHLVGLLLSLALPAAAHPESATEALKARDAEIRAAGAGYDINFVLAQGWLPGRPAETLPVAARLVSPSGDLAMEIATSEPGLQFYEGIHLAPTTEDFDGAPHRPYSGLCLEPQRFPDTVNRPHFGSVVLRPGETYRQISRFRFHAP